MLNRNVWGSGLAVSGVLLAAAALGQDAPAEQASSAQPVAEAETAPAPDPSASGDTRTGRRSAAARGGLSRSLEESIALQREVLFNQTLRDGLITSRGLRVGESEDSSGTLRTAKIATQLEANDNYNLRSTSLGDALIWTTSLTLSQISRTSVDSFQGSVAGDARLADLPVVGTDAALDNPTVALLYARAVDDNSARARFSFNDADVEFFDPLRAIAPNGEIDDVRGTGRRRASTATLRFALAQDGPLSFAFGLRGQTIDYYDTTDPSLHDRNEYGGDAELRFDVTETVRGLVGVDYRYRDETDTVERTTWNAYTGLTADVNQVQRMELRLGYSEVEALRPSEEDRNESGVTGSLLYVIDRPNGDLRFDLNSRIQETGRRTEASVERNKELLTGLLSAQLGLSFHANQEVRPFANLVWSVENATSSFNIALRQNFNVNRDGDDVLNANLSANYRYLINPVSSISLAATTAREEYLDEDTDQNDLTRITFVAGYNHVLARDWELRAGYRYRSRFRDEGDDSQSNSVFLQLDRYFFGRN